MNWAKRRRYKRYAPSELTFAVLSDASPRVGAVVSVSRGGLAFVYTPVDEPAEAPVQDGSSLLELIIGPDPWYVPEIPCQVLYDFEMENDQRFPSSIEKRCCGLKFGELSEEQTKGLDTFLKGYVAPKGPGLTA